MPELDGTGCNLNDAETIGEVLGTLARLEALATAMHGQAITKHAFFTDVLGASGTTPDAFQSMATAVSQVAGDAAGLRAVIGTVYGPLRDIVEGGTAVPGLDDFWKTWTGAGAGELDMTLASLDACGTSADLTAVLNNLDTFWEDLSSTLRDCLEVYQDPADGLGNMDPAFVSGLEEMKAHATEAAQEAQDVRECWADEYGELCDLVESGRHIPGLHQFFADAA